MRVKILVTKKNDQIIWKFYDGEFKNDVIRHRVETILYQILEVKAIYVSDPFNEENASILIIKLASGEILYWE